MFDNIIISESQSRKNPSQIELMYVKTVISMSSTSIVAPCCSTFTFNIRIVSAVYFAKFVEMIYNFQKFSALGNCDWWSIHYNNFQIGGDQSPLILGIDGHRIRLVAPKVHFADVEFGSEVRILICPETR